MKKSSKKQQESRINNGLFFLNFPPNTEHIWPYFFLIWQSVYFPFSYSFLFSCHFQETTLSNDRYIYMCVTFQPGPGRWCAGAGGQLPTGSPPPCPERDGARVPQAPGTPVHLCLAWWVLCNGEELVLPPRWGAPRLLRTSADKDWDFEAVGSKGRKESVSTHLELLRGSQVEWS